MSRMVPMNHPELPEQPIEVLPEQVPAFEDSGWATDGATADDPTPVPLAAEPGQLVDELADTEPGQDEGGER